ncbi:hypothetical protein [Lactococcus allomyrinae]|uniref:LXG domain-containing protein n=1 Tax=Lactococcus allomyrinae TaxID=2419773 RepID=A0A387BJ19_9LACT|nr:hypothetical protein [Lactococcus allomyrinae]AYG01339.1 hypothetical protein D7I46_09670 [Lactococcus allomyrinae]
MGLIYDSGESHELIEALSSNITISYQITNGMSKGSTHLISTLNRGELSGVAYHAGKNLFEAVIHPTILKVKQAIEDIKSDLSAYKSADSSISHYGHLDMEILQQQHRLIQETMRTVEEQIQLDQDFSVQMSNVLGGNVLESVRAFSEAQALQEQLERLERLKQGYEEKMSALESFSSMTASLFSDSLAVFQSAMQGIKMLNGTTFDSGGNPKYPAGSNLNWLSTMRNQSLDNGTSYTDSKIKNKYKNRSSELKAIEKLSLEMGISLEEAEKLHLSFQKLGKNQKELDKLKQTSEVVNAYFSKIKEYPKIHDNDNIELITVSYGEPDSDNVIRYVVNTTTNKLVSIEAGSSMKTLLGYVGSADRWTQWNSAIPKVKDQEVIQSTNIAKILKQFGEINSTLKTTTIKKKGKEYLEELTRLESEAKKKREIENKQKSSTMADDSGHGPIFAGTGAQ